MIETTASVLTGPLFAPGEMTHRGEQKRDLLLAMLGRFFLHLGDQNDVSPRIARAQATVANDGLIIS